MSQPLKEKFFARMDTLNMGLISFQQFKDVLTQNAFSEPQQAPIADSFNWEQQQLKSILGWIQEKNFSLSQAFKVIDHDFDRSISVEDLRKFLVEKLKVDLSEIQNFKLERLHKIMDTSKTGKIFLSDFEQLFSHIHNKRLQKINQGQSGLERSRLSQSFIGRNSKTQSLIEESDTFIEWKTGAIQQIGLYLSRKFSSLQDSFNEVATRLNDGFEMIVKLSEF